MVSVDRDLLLGDPDRLDNVRAAQTLITLNSIAESLDRIANALAQRWGV